MRARSRRLSACIFLALAAPALADSPWLYGIHFYGDPAGSLVESMTGGKGIWALECVQTNSDIWWSAAWQRDNRFNAMVARGHSLICRIERNWGETVPFPGHLDPYLLDVQAAAQSLANVCHIWQIGNEMNLYGEWGGQVLTPAEYVAMYKQIRAAIQAVPSPLGPQIVLLGPVSPGGVEPGVRHTDGDSYLLQMCDLLTPADVDGFAIHSYAAPWTDVPNSRRDLQATYLTQLAILEHSGFRDQPVFLTEWNRRVDPINDAAEASSAQFLHAAFADLQAWNRIAGAHPVTGACWFIYGYDSGGWANYSIAYLHTVGPAGPDNDLFDAFQYAGTQNYPAVWPNPGPPMTAAAPTGINVARHAVAVTTDTGDGTLAIDGVVSVASKWTSTGDTALHWLQLDLGVSRPLTGWIVRHANAAGESPSFATAAFAVLTADQPAGPWTLDAHVYNRTAAATTPRTYAGMKTARYVKLLISDPGIDNYARIPEFEVYAPHRPGDYDGDGDVDATDLQWFAFCLRGPGRVYAPGTTCLRGDADGDLDVDLADLAAIQRPAP